MDPATDTESEMDRIKSRIGHIVQSSFDSGQEVVYLAYLGSILGADRTTLERLTNVKLATYIRENFDYTIEVTGPYKNVLYIAHPNRRSSQTPVASPPAYARWFWTAFAKPLLPGETARLINLDTCVFGPPHTLMQAHSSGDVRKIEPEYIAPSDASGSSAQTAERIAKWIEQEGLDGKRFMIERKRSIPKGDNLLASLMNALTGEQLKRITLPLDVVKALSEHRT